MCSLEPQIDLVVASLLPLYEKRLRGLGLGGVRPFRQQTSRARLVLAPRTVICIASRARESHLQELPRHVHSDEVAVRPVFEELPVDPGGRLARDCWRAESPMRQDFALVGFGQ